MSVQKAASGLEVEIIVVDNNSSDGSCEMLKEKFADEIVLIENKDNPGFSKANNQGIAISKGRYVLLLNPDTVVEEQTFSRCIQFMDERPKAGALGVQMIDGEGHFLPESKRALPTPWVSFYKIFGLSNLFPKNKKFGRYHLSYLDKETNHQIEVLSGAYMFLRKECLDKIGLLDDTFFMYGEDIDLSYRVILGGYENYYLADTTILHYKGESTKKGSLNYVRVFYQAMIIFARKHFGGNRKRLFILAIRLAVYFRALLAIIHRLIKTLGFPLIEAGLIYATMFGIKSYWEHYVKFIVGGSYPDSFTYGYLPVYALVFVLFLWMAGAYKRPFKLKPLILGPLGAFVAIATLTYMFSPIRNFSRAIVGLSAVFTAIIAFTSRGLINWRNKGSFFFTELTQQRVALVGDGASIKRINQLIQGELHYPAHIIGGICMDRIPSGSALEKLGELTQLKTIIQSFDINELIFCGGKLSNQEILAQLKQLKDMRVAFKIVPADTNFVIGPKQIFASRQDSHKLSPLFSSRKKIQKHTFDLISVASLLLLFPIMGWKYERPLKAFKGLVGVLVRRKHIVGYIDPAPPTLPPLKKGLLNMNHRSDLEHELARLPAAKLDRFYAQQFRWELDLEILLKNWRKIQ